MGDRPLVAVTLWRPWAALIVHGLKAIENRSWEPPTAQLRPGQWLAIHAGKQWDDDCLDFALANGVSRAFLDDPANRVESAIVGVARYDGCVRASEDPWFVGPVGWQLPEAVAIAPVECRGRQKLWVVAPSVADEVRRRFKGAREARKEAVRG